MENIKNKSGRKKLSDDKRRSHEVTIYMNDEEFKNYSSCRDKFGNKKMANAIRENVNFLYKSYISYYS